MHRGTTRTVYLCSGMDSTVAQTKTAYCARFSIPDQSDKFERQNMYFGCNSRFHLASKLKKTTVHTVLCTPCEQ